MITISGVRVMSDTLKMVAEELTQFTSGKIDLDTMWDQINSNLHKMRCGEDHTDPFEDDKAELRTRLQTRN